MTATLEGDEWSAARPGRTLPLGRPGIHFTGGGVGPRADLEVKTVILVKVSGFNIRVTPLSFTV